MAFRPLEQETEAYQAAYLSIRERLHNHPAGVFRLDLLFGADWNLIGNGRTRQHFGRRFRRAVLAGQFTWAAIDAEQPFEVPGNEARFVYRPNGPVP